MLLYALTILVSAFLLVPGAAGDRQDHSALVRRLGRGLDHLPAVLPDGAAARVSLRPRAWSGTSSRACRCWSTAACCWSASAVLPIYPSVAWKPHRRRRPHLLGILRLLALTVGLPYFLLSTTGPLLQAWYARRLQRRACRTGCTRCRMPARCSRCSAIRCCSSRSSTTHEQAWMWSIAYGVFIALCGFTAVRVGAMAHVVEATGGSDAAGEAAALRQYAFWLAAAGLRLGAAAGHHQSPLAERGGHSVPVGAAAQPLPAELHPVLRKQRLVPAQSYLQTAGGGAGQSMAYADGADATGNMPDQGPGAAVLAWGCSPAAWCATANWPGSSRIPAISRTST